MAWEVPCGMSLAVPDEMLLWPGMSLWMWDVPMAWDVLFLMSGTSPHLATTKRYHIR
ncbi:hypothetical protein F5880DRAFT_1618738 [Lentinula raphanica]|nr:hypothetical protein F5880DRAFT_1618738 [Lentinula raphanica]